MGYTAVTVEGGLFPSDLLDRIATGEAEGQRAVDFGLDGSRRLVDEIQSAFSDARSFWDAFQRRLERSRESRTTITREDWVVPFLELLGFYNLQLQRASLEAGGESFFISHVAGDEPGAPPVHIVALDQDLDRRNGARRSPHALVQDYLNRSDALWGIVTNGRHLRLLRDSARLSKPTYLEFDLEGMIASNLYSEFVLLYRLLHASRFPRDGATAHECLLERYYQQGIDEGGRVRDKLRDGVQAALEVLGTAFLAHPDSGALRDKFARGQLDAPRYYRQLLRLVYRLLFLMVAEERRLIFPPDADATRQAVYTKYYSVTRLRDRAERYFAGDENGDLWVGLRQTFRLFRDHDAAQKLGLSALDGELFGPHACEDLEGARCTNEALLSAVRHLSTFVDDGGVRRRRVSGVRRRVNYAGLDVEEFGSVYESLLDYHPQVTLGPPRFDLVAGSERKQTGSYYTPPQLVHELIESALVPVMEKKLRAAKTREEKERALLDLRVCDPAAGSGHFLLAAARRIARELAKVRSGEDEPAPDEYRHALRDVIRQCVYAVDKNPLAVDLCKVALWIEGHNAGLPLSFLDHHVKCGDSLVGVFDLRVLEEGIPDEAYKPVTGDDKAAARYYRDRNRQEKRGQRGFESLIDHPDIPDEIAAELRALAEQDERSPDDVHAKEELYAQMRARGTEWERLKIACDLWTYAFFAPMPAMNGAPSPLVPTTGVVRDQLRSGSARGDAIGAAVACSQAHPFFHWPLEFPDVFEQGGFDVVLGNPPWDRVKLQQQEFFSTRSRRIAEAPNAAARNRMIAALAQSEDPADRALHAEYVQALRQAENSSVFLHDSGRFPLGGRGDVNLYAVFAELARTAIRDAGRAGVILPSGIATDDTTKVLFGSVAASGQLVGLLDFENREGIFPGIDSRMKFCLFTIRGSVGSHAEPAEFAFFCTDVAHLAEDERRFTLSPEDFALFNPNTRTCPTFRSRRDAEIARKLYRRAGVFWREARDGQPEDNPWGVAFQRMFDMSNDSHLFRTREELSAQGFALHGNVFRHPDGREYLPLYEAKLFHQYDHRYATFDGCSEAERRSGNARELTPAEKADPATVVIPRYWVPAGEVASRLDSGRLSGAEREREREQIFARLAAGNWRFETLHGRRTSGRGSTQ